MSPPLKPCPRSWRVCSWQIALLATLFASQGCALGLNGSQVSAPYLELSQLGRIAFTGNFDAISTYKYGSIISTSATTESSLLGGQTIRAQLPDGTFTKLAPSDGSIEEICLLTNASQTKPLGIVLAGNFTHLAGSNVSGIAMYEYDDGKVTTLPGLSGKTYSLLCDSTTGSIYAAGSFTGANSSNIMRWSGTTGWSRLPFGGTNGPINKMEKTSSGTILFGGNFTAFTSLAGTLPNTKLNGVVEWDPTRQTFDPSARTLLMNASLDLRPGAQIYDILTVEGMTFVAGNFSSAGIKNVFVFEDGKSTALPAGGLNGPVNTLLYLHDLRMLVVGGNFSSTGNSSVEGLNNLAAYSIGDQRWYALGAGVDGAVDSLNIMALNISSNEPEAIVIVNGDFNHLLGFEGNNSVPVNGTGVWAPSQSNWLPNLNLVTQPQFEGRLTKSIEAPGNLRLFAGTLSSWMLSARGAISFTYLARTPVLEDLGLKLQTTGSGGGDPSILTGLFHREKLDITVLGGAFTAQGQGSEAIHNVAFINGSSHDRISGMRGFVENGTVECLQTVDENLLVGGSFQQAIQGQAINGLVRYDLLGDSYADTQPPTLGGPAVAVKIMSIRPSSNEVYVGGTFETAGDLDCPSVCIYDPASSTWARPGSGLGGSVRYMTWTGPNSLVVGGDITIDDKPVSLATYYAPADHWTPFNDLQPLYGTITAMTYSGRQISAASGWSSDSLGFWIAGYNSTGAAFLKQWTGSSWLNVTEGFASNSSIQYLQPFSLGTSHQKTEFLSSNIVLMVLGNIILPDIGAVSAALFNGTEFIPFISTKSASGSAGSLSSIFVENSGFFSSSSDKDGKVFGIAAAVLAILVSVILVGELENIWHQRRTRPASQKQTAASIGLAEGKAATRESTALLRKVPDENSGPAGGGE